MFLAYETQTNCLKLAAAQPLSERPLTQLYADLLLAYNSQLVLTQAVLIVQCSMFALLGQNQTLLFVLQKFAQF